MISSRHKSRRIEISDSASLVKAMVWGGVILAGLIAVLFFAYRVNRELRPPEYQGKIIDKWSGFNYTDQGSIPYFRLHLETADGQKATVAVAQQTYNRAQVGMWIKKTKEGFELSMAVGPNVTLKPN